jgi:hypothetical protein
VKENSPLRQQYHKLQRNAKTEIIMSIPSYPTIGLIYLVLPTAVSPKIATFNLKSAMSYGKPSATAPEANRMRSAV